jgi:hydrogenase maturation protease
VPDKNVLIVGFGNPLRGDDAVGLLAARELAQHGLRAIEVPQLTPELAETVATARTVIFLDAHAGLSPGGVSLEPIDRTAGADSPLEHYSGPAGLLRLARTAYGAEPEAWIVNMGGLNFDLGDHMSIAGHEAVARAVQEVIRCTNRES